jgi:5-formyltetrahydrofolate cyclo-ligase
MTPDDVRAHSATITQVVSALPPFQTASTLCSYLAIGHEVRTQELIALAWAQGTRVVLPRTIFATRQLALHAVTSFADLVPGRYGILEPPADAPLVDPQEVELFLVPGVAFDAQGHRLGYGAGFYDGLLAQSAGWRVALAYGGQLTPHVPTDAHDVPMHALATEGGVIDCLRAQRASDHLRLRNLQCYGYHGAFPAEREQGIRLAFDLDLRLDLQGPGLSDALPDTVNYPAIVALVQRIQCAQSVNLLETLAEQIARAILAEHRTVQEVTITVRKFQPPVGQLLDVFEVEITRARSLWEG